MAKIRLISTFDCYGESLKALLVVFLLFFSLIEPWDGARVAAESSSSSEKVYISEEPELDEDNADYPEAAELVRQINQIRELIATHNKTVADQKSPRERQIWEGKLNQLQGKMRLLRQKLTAHKKVQVYSPRTVVEIKSAAPFASRLQRDEKDEQRSAKPILALPSEQKQISLSPLSKDAPKPKDIPPVKDQGNAIAAISAEPVAQTVNVFQLQSLWGSSAVLKSASRSAGFAVQSTAAKLESQPGGSNEGQDTSRPSNDTNEGSASRHHYLKYESLEGFSAEEPRRDEEFADVESMVIDAQYDWEPAEPEQGNVSEFGGLHERQLDAPSSSQRIGGTLPELIDQTSEPISMATPSTTPAPASQDANSPAQDNANPPAQDAVVLEVDRPYLRNWPNPIERQTFNGPNGQTITRYIAARGALGAAALEFQDVVRDAAGNFLRTEEFREYTHRLETCDVPQPGQRTVVATQMNARYGLEQMTFVLDADGRQVPGTMHDTGFVTDTDNRFRTFIQQRMAGDHSVASFTVGAAPPEESEDEALDQVDTALPAPVSETPAENVPMQGEQQPPQPFAAVGLPVAALQAVLAAVAPAAPAVPAPAAVVAGPPPQANAVRDLTQGEINDLGLELDKTLSRLSQELVVHYWSRGLDIPKELLQDLNAIARETPTWQKASNMADILRHFKNLTPILQIGLGERRNQGGERYPLMDYGEAEKLILAKIDGLNGAIANVDEFIRAGESEGPKYRDLHKNARKDADDAWLEMISPLSEVEDSAGATAAHGRVTNFGGFGDLLDVPEVQAAVDRAREMGYDVPRRVARDAEQSAMMNPDYVLQRLSPLHNFHRKMQESERLRRAHSEINAITLQKKEERKRLVAERDALKRDLDKLHSPENLKFSPDASMRYQEIWGLLKNLHINEAMSKDDVLPAGDRPTTKVRSLDSPADLIGMVNKEVPSPANISDIVNYLKGRPTESRGPVLSRYAAPATTAKKAMAQSTAQSYAYYLANTFAGHFGLYFNSKFKDRNFDTEAAQWLAKLQERYEQEMQRAIKWKYSADEKNRITRQYRNAQDHLEQMRIFRNQEQQDFQEMYRMVKEHVEVLLSANIDDPRWVVDYYEHSIGRLGEKLAARLERYRAVEEAGAKLNNPYDPFFNMLPSEFQGNVQWTYIQGDGYIEMPSMQIVPTAAGIRGGFIDAVLYSRPGHFDLRSATPIPLETLKESYPDRPPTPLPPAAEPKVPEIPAGSSLSQILEEIDRKTRQATDWPEGRALDQLMGPPV